MQNWSASSSADDSDSSRDTRLRPEERLKRRQRVKRRMLTRSASSDSSSDFIPSTQQAKNVVVKEEENEKRGQEKSSSFQWIPLKNALISLLTSPSKKSKPKPVHKKILRSPVPHVYMKGPSGLPTQRVPMSAANWQLADFYSAHNLDTLRALMLEM